MVTTQNYTEAVFVNNIVSEIMNLLDSLQTEWVTTYDFLDGHNIKPLVTLITFRPK
jgi:hypothetical protein